MDAELERVLADIEMRFDAELKRQEEEGADDLAARLRQDRLLRGELQRTAAVLLNGGRRHEVSVVGRDYVGSGWPLSCVTKIELAVVALEASGTPPATRNDTFIEVVRRWQRAGLRVELSLPDGCVTGVLNRVAGDHVLIGTSSGPLMVALPAVAAIRLVRGG